jgi:hypothetical protein
MMMQIIMMQLLMLKVPTATTRIMTNGIIGQGGRIMLPICTLNSNEYHLHVHHNIMNVTKATAAAMAICKEDVATIRANGSIINNERQLI